MLKYNIKLNNFLYISASLFVVIFGFSIILFSILASKSYCENKKNTECIHVGTLSIPNNSLPNLIGSFTGAFFTFCTLYFLEETKRRAQPKPKIEVSFEPDTTASEDKFGELVVKCEPHYIYLEDKKKNLAIGNACYLRVKVTNRGNIVGRNCRAYLKKIEKMSPDGNYKTLQGYEDSMPLLWAYERKEDYFVVGLGRDLASQASDYADILVSYESYFSTNLLENGSPGLDKWFLKLKTKRQVPKYAKLFNIDFSAQCGFRLTIEVYADECSPSKIKIVLTHDENKDFVQVYDDEKKDRKAELRLYSSINQDNMPSECSIGHIYESL
jgi:hypothetical protein